VKTRFSLRPPHYLFAAAVVVRLFALAHLTSSPSLMPSGGDMHFYDAWGQRLARGETTGEHAFYGLPGYAYLLAIIYRICGYGPFVPAFLQAVIDGATAVLIYELTKGVIAPLRTRVQLILPDGVPRVIATHSREIAPLLAGLGWVFFVPAQAYAVILMPTSLAVFIFVLVVWYLARKIGPPSPVACFVLGLLLGLTATAVATVLFLLPLIVAALLIRPPQWSRRGLRLMLCMLLLLSGLSAGTATCWIHNCFIARDPVLLSAHSGINFWIGNNPEANGYPRFPPGLRAGQAAMLQDSIEAAEAAAGHVLTRGDISRFWSNKAREYIEEHPADWLRLEWTKLHNVASAFQYDDLSIITRLREEGVIFPGIYFGVVAALALPGILLAWSSAAARWLLAAICLHVAALLPVFVTERYRLAVVPGLLVFAAVGVELLWRASALGLVRIIMVYFASVVASTSLVSWPQRDVSLWALDAYNTGRQALESNDLRSAEAKLLLARAYVPDNAETNFALGNLRLAQGEHEAAADFYRNVLSINPRHEGALNNLGVMSLETNDLQRAKLYFEAAVAQNPRNAKTHFLLAKTALAAGDHAMARRELTEALRILPNQSEFRALQTQLGQ
jgi:hypothetical protein